MCLVFWRSFLVISQFGIWDTHPTMILWSLLKVSPESHWLRTEDCKQILGNESTWDSKRCSPNSQSKEELIGNVSTRISVYKCRLLITNWSKHNGQHQYHKRKELVNAHRSICGNDLDAKRSYFCHSGWSTNWHFFISEGHVGNSNHWSHASAWHVIIDRKGLIWHVRILGETHLIEVRLVADDPFCEQWSSCSSFVNIPIVLACLRS